ncbi:hypothetical protein BJ170DRAFT_712483 [Xylariales sp. AK1849]|nr:hypothetical protein BJ170DRAFT_712483 [Xylariales sp. AK1849]
MGRTRPSLSTPDELEAQQPHQSAKQFEYNKPSYVRDCTYKILPLCISVLVIFSIGAVMVCTLGFDKPVPRQGLVVVSIIFWSLVFLFIVGFIKMYHDQHHSHISRVEYPRRAARVMLKRFSTWCFEDEKEKQNAQLSLAAGLNYPQRDAFEVPGHERAVRSQSVTSQRSTQRPPPVRVANSQRSQELPRSGKPPAQSFDEIAAQMKASQIPLAHPTHVKSNRQEHQGAAHARREPRIVYPGRGQPKGSFPISPTPISSHRQQYVTDRPAGRGRKEHLGAETSQTQGQRQDDRINLPSHPLYAHRALGATGNPGDYSLGHNPHQGHPQHYCVLLPNDLGKEFFSEVNCSSDGHFVIARVVPRYDSRGEAMDADDPTIAPLCPKSCPIKMVEVHLPRPGLDKVHSMNTHIQDLTSPTCTKSSHDSVLDDGDNREPEDRLPQKDVHSQSDSLRRPRSHSTSDADARAQKCVQRSRRCKVQHDKPIHPVRSEEQKSEAETEIETDKSTGTEDYIGNASDEKRKAVITPSASSQSRGSDMSFHNCYGHDGDETELSSVSPSIESSVALPGSEKASLAH